MVPVDDGKRDLRNPDLLKVFNLECYVETYFGIAL